MSAPLRVALVGAGWVSLTRHLPSLVAHPDVVVRGIIAPEVHQRTEVAELKARHDIAWLADSLATAPVEDLDMVMIGTPPDSHEALVVDALGADLHVLVEKPFALTTAAADAMIAAAERSGRTLGLVHNLQFSRASQRARALVDQGRIGELRGVFGVQSSNHQRRLPTWYKQLPLGLFTDEAPHLIYLLQSFVPDAELETLHVGPHLATDDNTPDLVSAVVRSDTGTFGSLQMTFVGAVSEWLLVLAGTKGTVLVDFFRDTCVRLPDDHGHLGADVVRTQVAAVGGHLAGTFTAGVQRLRGRLDYGNDEVVRRFVAAVRTGEEPAGISAHHGRAVVEVLDAAHRAARPATDGR